MARVLITHPANASTPVLDVALSERNILTLLIKAHTPFSTCAFDCYDVPKELGFSYARVHVEPDEFHYGASPTREGAPPGQMHPLTECVLIAIRTALAEFTLNADNADNAAEGWEP